MFVRVMKINVCAKVLAGGDKPNTKKKRSKKKKKAEDPRTQLAEERTQKKPTDKAKERKEFVDKTKKINVRVFSSLSPSPLHMLRLYNAQCDLTCRKEIIRQQNK